MQEFDDQQIVICEDKLQVDEIIINLNFDYNNVF